MCRWKFFFSLPLCWMWFRWLSVMKGTRDGWDSEWSTLYMHPLPIRLLRMLFVLCYSRCTSPYLHTSTMRLTQMCGKVNKNKNTNHEYRKVLPFHCWLPTELLWLRIVRRISNEFLSNQIWSGTIVGHNFRNVYRHHSVSLSWVGWVDFEFLIKKPWVYTMFVILSAPNVGVFKIVD